METELYTIQAQPFSKEAEEAVLGAALGNPETVPMFRGIVNKSDDFYLIKNRYIWEALCSLDDRKSPIDIVTVAEELDRRGRLNEVGGFPYVSILINSSPNLYDGEAQQEHAKIVHAFGFRRRMLQAGSSIASLAYDESIHVEDVASACIEAVQQATNGLLGGRAQEAASLASEYYDMVGERANAGVLPGIPTGFFDLDVLLGGGLQKGELTLVAGFSGVGKTAFLDTIVLHVSQTYHTDLFTLEMGSKERMNRMVAQMTGINSQRLRSGRLEDDEWSVFTNAIGEMSGRKLRIDDGTPLSMATLRAKSVQRKAMGKLDLIVVDYAGLMDGIGTSEYETHSYLSRNLKLLAQEIDTPILAAHQFNRKGHDYEKPSMWHLRGSGTWEQDSNNVLLIYEPKETVTTREFAPRKVEIAKQRNGPTGTVDLLMRASTTRFENTKGETNGH